MEKETIIFLHGMIGNKNAFKKEIETLSANYHCIAYDFYGLKEFGAEDPRSLDQFIEQLYHQFKKNKVKKAHLCALSFGGTVSIAFAKRYPHMVESLTLIGGYCCNVPSQFHTNVIQVLEEKKQYDYTTWIKRCARLLNPNSQSIGENSEIIFHKYALMLQPAVLESALRIHLSFDTLAALRTINMPILWIMGENDELYKGTLPNLELYIPHVVYKEIKQAGHVAHVHQPNEFMSLYQSFLKNYLFINA